MSKEYRHIICYILVVLFFLTSCNKEDESAEFSGHLSIELRKFFGNGTRNTALLVVSREEYPCSNFEIKYETSLSGNRKLINFSGIKLYDACVTSVGPAKAYIDLGAIPPGSQDDLVFVVNNESVSTSLTGDHEIIALDVVKGDNTYIEIKNARITRLPGNFIWGYIHSKADDGEVDGESFCQSLWDAGVVKEELPPGNYGFFSISDGKFELFESEYTYLAENYFLGSYDGEFGMLKDIAVEFREEYVIAIYSGLGDIFHNQ